MLPTPEYTDFKVFREGKIPVILYKTEVASKLLSKRIHSDCQASFVNSLSEPIEDSLLALRSELGYFTNPQVGPPAVAFTVSD